MEGRRVVSCSSDSKGSARSRLAESRAKLLAATAEREFFTSARPTSLLERFAPPEEVANMIVYVASEAASATNGAALRVDGGVVRSIA